MQYNFPCPNLDARYNFRSKVEDCGTQVFLVKFLLKSMFSYNINVTIKEYVYLLLLLFKGQKKLWYMHTNSRQ